MAGSWEAVDPDNYRVKSDSEAEARAYITEIVGFRQSDIQLFAILRVRYQMLGPTVNRKGWRSLSPQTKKDYLGSSSAQAEARAHNMTVPQWYAKAPDLKAFRRKARGRTGSESVNKNVEFLVYIARKYRGTISDVEGLQASIHAAHERRTAVFAQDFFS